MTRIYHRESRRKISSTTEISREDTSSSSTSSANNSTSSSAPCHYGLMITLNNKGVCELSFCADAHCVNVHPNTYAPAALEHVQSLGGGGSGVAVFGGRHPELGDLVMKHGGHKDLAELFALATIAKELDVRGGTTRQSTDAARHLRQCIPEFRMIYISPFHLGEKRRNLFRRLCHLYKYASFSSSHTKVLLPKNSNPNNNNIPGSATTKHPNALLKNEAASSSTATAKRAHHCNRCLDRSPTGATAHRDISVFACNDKHPNCSVQLVGDSLKFVIPQHRRSFLGADILSSDKRRIQLENDGYEMLKALVDNLLPLMKENQWKFTLGQKRIGGSQPRTGNSWLYSSQLEGRLLDNLISQKIKTVHDLVSLTTPEEQDPKALNSILEEVAALEEAKDHAKEPPFSVSHEADAFVGNSIKKNFETENSRFPLLLLLGSQFREYYKEHCHHHHENNAPGCICAEGSCSMILTPEEEIAAHHLGSLTQPGALLGDMFENVSSEPCVLDTMHPQNWRNLLKLAVQPRVSATDKTSTMALTRIWTCGFSDAGLHNLFCSEDSLWLFDLGQPQLTSVPGFLTKFLFSFFHTLGMEEVPGSKGAEWVNRFVIPEDPRGKLRLTQDTEQKLAHAYKAFEATLDRLVEELFDGDNSLRWTLLQFVTLQLFSDASFCLQRWTVKGGGRGRDLNHQKGIEKWLWRALWDMRVALDMNSKESWSRLKVEHPSKVFPFTEAGAVQRPTVDAPTS